MGVIVNLIEKDNNSKKIKNKLIRIRNHNLINLLKRNKIRFRKSKLIT